MINKMEYKEETKIDSIKSNMVQRVTVILHFHHVLPQEAILIAYKQNLTKFKEILSWNEIKDKFSIYSIAIVQTFNMHVLPY